MTDYVAFLRGINVGGHGVVTMDALTKAFEALGFEEVRTLGASGNVSFRAGAAKDLRTRIERALGCKVQLRTRAELRAIVDADPFRGARVTPNTKKVVTFLDATPAPGLKLPHVEGSSRILTIRDGAAFSTYERACAAEAAATATRRRGSKGASFMTVLEKAFGKNVTTRTWDVVRKLSDV